MLFVWLILDPVLAERRLGVLERDRLPVDPEDRAATRQPLLAVELPAPEARRSPAIQAPREAGGVEDAVQLLGRAQRRSDPPEYLRRTEAVVVAQAVSPMRLRIVVLDKARVNLFGSLPTGHLLEMVVISTSPQRL